MNSEWMPALLDVAGGGFVESVDGYRALLDDLAEGVVVVDSGEIVRFANRRAEIIFGAAPGALVGRRLGEPGRLALGGTSGPVSVDELPVASALLRGRATANAAMTADLEAGTRVW